MALDLSAPPQKTRRRSPKQHIRIWFEFYKLALSDPRFSDPVQRSQNFYRPWGEIAGLSFDKWWTGHSHLFDELRVREIQAVTRSEAVIHLALPLSLGAKEAMVQVKEIFTERQREIAARLGDRRTKSTSEAMSGLSSKAVNFLEQWLAEELLVRASTGEAEAEVLARFDAEARAAGLSEVEVKEALRDPDIPNVVAKHGGST